MPDTTPRQDPETRRAEPQSARPGTRRWLKRTLAVALILALVAGLAWVLTPQAQQQQGRRGRFAQGGPMPVVAATVRTGDMPVMLNALGTVTPLATVVVRPRISGELTQVGFKEGQTVAAGDFLAEIDPRPYQAALDQAEGQLQRDQALLAGARNDLARYRRLAAQDSIARQQLDTQEALVRQYEGTVAADTAAVETARLNFQYCRITAPIGGRVGLRQVDPGNYVQASDTNGIVVITQMKPISVVFSIAEDALHGVMQRLRAGATLPVTVYDRSRSKALAAGVLATVDNQIDTATGTIKLRARIENEEERLFPNQFVNVALEVNVLKDAMLVPSPAIQRGAEGSFVYTIGHDLTVKATQVKLGPDDGKSVVVASGLSPGERVVVDGADRLRDGAKVALPGASAGAPARPQGSASGGEEPRRRRNAQ